MLSACAPVASSFYIILHKKKTGPGVTCKLFEMLQIMHVGCCFKSDLRWAGTFHFQHYNNLQSVTYIILHNEAQTFNCRNKKKTLFSLKGTLTYRAVREYVLYKLNSLTSLVETMRDRKQGQSYLQNIKSSTIKELSTGVYGNIILPSKPGNKYY